MAYSGGWFCCGGVGGVGGASTALNRHNNNRELFDVRLPIG